MDGKVRMGEAGAILHECLGKVLKSIELVPEKASDGLLAYGCVRINLHRTSLDVTNEDELIEFAGYQEERPVLACERIAEAKAIPISGTAETRLYLVDDVINSIEIVRDFIRSDANAWAETVDVALVLHCNQASYIIAKIDTISEYLRVVKLAAGADIVANLAPIDAMWGHFTDPATTECEGVHVERRAVSL